jgi:putative membrane protein
MKAPKTKVYFVAAMTLALFAFSGMAKAQSMDDAQIAETMKTANEAEVKAAKVAKSKASDSQVRDFANMMITEHEQNIKDAKNIEKKQKISPKSNDMAKSVKKDAGDKLSDLKKDKGAEFDKTYIAQQIDMHQDLLNKLDKDFIPAANNAEFKAYLSTTREHVATHLAKAQAIQASLK